MRNMNKMVKKIALALVCVMMVSVLGGCGAKFDAVKYVSAVLDNSYKNDSSKYVEMKIATAEEAAKVYDQGIEANISALVSGATLSEELMADYEELIKDIYASAKYTVVSAELQDDKSYVVDVEIEKLKVFEAGANQFIEKIKADPTSFTTNEDVYASMLECFKDQLNNKEYAEAETKTVKLTLNDNVYTPDQKDLEQIEYALFDIEEMLNAVMAMYQ